METRRPLILASPTIRLYSVIISCQKCLGNVQPQALTVDKCAHFWEIPVGQALGIRIAVSSFHAFYYHSGRSDLYYDRVQKKSLPDAYGICYSKRGRRLPKGVHLFIHFRFFGDR